MEASVARDCQLLRSDRVDSAAARHTEALKELARAQKRVKATGHEFEAALEVALKRTFGDDGDDVDPWALLQGAG